MSPPALCGASFTGRAVRLKLAGSLVSTPLLAVRPLSCTRNVKLKLGVGVPLDSRSVLGVNFSWPLEI